ncbi:MAG: dethiobiotin synthase [Flavobacterium sp.]
MNKKTIFITGIGTDVGKTITSAIITEALQADYWKPVQAGDLHLTDSMKVEQLVSNPKSVFHPSVYAMQTPASPHYAAALDETTIELSQLKRPKTKNHLIIEGAGGLLVPLNDQHTILDLIHPDDFVIVVSRHYLGSINHTLLTLEFLKAAGLKNIGIIFSGDPYASTEDIILKKSQLPMIGRIEVEPFFDQNVVLEYAERFLPDLEKFING